MIEVEICEWLRGKFLFNRYTLDVEEIKDHVQQCEKCSKLFESV